MAKKVVKADTEKVAKLARPRKYVYYFGDGKDPIVVSYDS